jgi:hypothetical protein
MEIQLKFIFYIVVTLFFYLLFKWKLYVFGLLQLK